MSDDKKVQFVCFETTLDKEAFIKRWDQYTRSANSNKDVTLQQSEKNSVFKYIAQHRFVSGELSFVFSKEGRTSRLAQTTIKTTQAGGYSMMQAERLQVTNGNERKIFVFLTDPRVDLKEYRAVHSSGKLNIYQAYYENCKYAYILEYFVHTKDTAALINKLNSRGIEEAEIYKECAIDKNPNKKKEIDFYVWPTV